MRPVDVEKRPLTTTEEGSKKKKEEDFRNYVNSERQELVEKTYRLMHVNQTVDFVRSMHDKWLKFDHGEFTIFELLVKLDELVDDSDPDTALPNSVHDLQTAERIRKAWPDHDWFHLVGLLHDVGKVLALWGEPQWATVGDTFPVGCKFSEHIIFPEHMKDNKDDKDARYNSVLGMYEANCGMDKLLVSFGHDEYMYQVLKHNGCTIPEEGLAMIRFHVRRPRAGPLRQGGSPRPSPAPSPSHAPLHGTRACTHGIRRAPTCSSWALATRRSSSGCRYVRHGRRWRRVVP